MIYYICEKKELHYYIHCQPILSLPRRIYCCTVKPFSSFSTQSLAMSQPNVCLPNSDERIGNIDADFVFQSRA